MGGTSSCCVEKELDATLCAQAQSFIQVTRQTRSHNTAKYEPIHSKGNSDEFEYIQTKCVIHNENVLNNPFDDENKELYPSRSSSETVDDSQSSIADNHNSSRKAVCEHISISPSHSHSAMNDNDNNTKRNPQSISQQDSDSDKESVLNDMLNDILIRTDHNKSIHTEDEQESIVRKDATDSQDNVEATSRKQPVTDNDSPSESTEDLDITTMNAPSKHEWVNHESAFMNNNAFDEDHKASYPTPDLQDETPAFALSRSSSETFDAETSIAKKSTHVSDQQRHETDTAPFEMVYSYHSQSETERRRVKAGSVHKLLQRQISNSPVASSLKLHRSASSLNTIDEDRKLDELSVTVTSTVDDEEHRMNTPQAFNSNQNDPSQNYQYGHMHTDQECTNRRRTLRTSTFKDIAFNLSSDASTDEKEKETFKRRKPNQNPKPAPAPPPRRHPDSIQVPPRSERTRNAMSPSFRSGDTHSSYFSIAKHQPRKPTPHVKRREKFERSRNESNVEQSKSDSEDDSYAEYSMSVSCVDSEQERASWAEYRDNLQRLFYLFAGYQRWSRKKGVYMSRNEVEQFLKIVEITKYWSVDQVFEVMDNDIVDRKVTLNEFVEYFCDCNNNPTASDIKKHIEKQVSWTLLLKALRIFDTIDADHSGQLEYEEFRRFGKMLNLNDKETEVLWHKIDKDKSGQITIVELFEWFKERLETARSARDKQNGLKSSGNARDFSGSHSSFDHDDTTETRSRNSTVHIR